LQLEEVETVARVGTQQTVMSRRRQLAGRLVRYYMAVRLSAAAASPTPIPGLYRPDPAPIVRVTPAQSGQWDTRECIDIDGAPAALTIPLNTAGVRRGSALGLN
jgi:hypothetical protein